MTARAREGVLRAALACGGLLAGLLAAEAATRLLSPRLFSMDSESHRFDPELAWVQREGRTMTRRNEAGEVVHVEGDPLGIRRPPRPYAEAGVRTVLLAGDSFTAGTQVRWEDTWAARLAAALAESDRGVQVVNAGVDGYDLTQTYRLARRLAGRFSPAHLVLAVYLGNDVRDYEAASAARPPWRRSTVRDRLAERSYLFHLARAAFRRPPAHLPPDEEESEAAAGWSPRSVPGFDALEPRRQGNLRRQFAAREMLPVLRDGPEAQRRLSATTRVLAAFADLSRERCAGLTVLLVPTKQQAVPAQRAEMAALHGLEEGAVLRPQRALAAWAEARGLSVVDATSTLAAEPDPAALYWKVNMHMSPAGHAALARAVLPAVRQGLDMPPCPRP